jgi:hypothetical protein
MGLKLNQVKTHRLADAYPDFQSITSTTSFQLVVVKSNKIH